MEKRNNLSASESKIKPPVYYEYIKKPNCGMCSSEILVVNRVFLGCHSTHIEIGHLACGGFEWGITIQLNSGIFIRPVGTDDRYYLINKADLPIAPKEPHYYLDPTEAVLTLVFQGIPKDVAAIDLIENERGGEHHYRIENIQIRELEPESVHRKWKSWN